eukprot:CAMPEP_0202820502 /NCGR_PEP_ID=MMETSP1389-20130828/9785_1 /ASSEMBLY_ACC=CAM_ASM_000865 /TAXON_ID=302021 /ORGANISM="Rhodomonas sp., Strain CCMP768" /LENGTH=65 /DNA_ID=CAMNT_0049493183 /DNA_START=239 /DNA_END=436 /DNA_ORIENTATION=-
MASPWLQAASKSAGFVVHAFSYISHPSWKSLMLSSPLRRSASVVSAEARLFSASVWFSSSTSTSE